MAKRRPFLKNKSGAINCCCSKGIELKGNICLASLKQTQYKYNPVFWADRNDESYLSNEHTFILNDYTINCFYIIFVPQGKLTPNLKRANRNNGLFDWNIRTGFYKDIDTGFDLSQFGVQKVEYTDQDIINFDI